MIKFSSHTKRTLKAKISLGFITLATVLSFVAPTVAKASFCDEAAKATAGFLSCGGEDSTTFTNFTGTLAKPDATGYDPGLTKATDARTYIKNIVNFALSFLGLIAVVIIIYGGFLYVTAAGNEEKATKGKKSVSYALIGILIILGSFAVVNTILQAPGGSEKPGTEVETSAQNRKAFFNYAASVVQTVARDLVTAYQNYAEIKIDLETLADADYAKDINTADDFRTIVSQKKTILTNILSKAGSLSQMAEKSREGIRVLDKYLDLSSKTLQKVAESREEKPDLDEDFWKAVKEFFGTSYDEFKKDLDKEFGESGLKKGNQEDFAQAVKKAYDKIADLQIRVKQTTDLPLVQTAFDNVVNDLKQLVPSGLADSNTNAIASLFMALAHAQSSLSLNASKANNAFILQIVNNLNALYEAVKDVQFVYTAITADVTSGNAPLVVNFDGLKSLDPNNNTIPDANYNWDFGDSGGGIQLYGVPSPNKATGATASHIFKQAGTYIVKLQIKAPTANTSAGQSQPADGIAYQTITVKPPSSRVKLTVSAEENPTDPNKIYVLSDYNSAGFQTADISSITFTTNEAENGIWFDASKTETGQGTKLSNLKDNPLVKVKWEFGDKSKQNDIQEGTADLLGTKVKFVYDKEGSYRVTLEITDDKGITDRKIFNIMVSSIAARATVTPGTYMSKNDQAQIDGSASASDNAPIKTYKYTLKDSKGATPIWFTPPAVETADSFKQTFKETGLYTLNLEVSNGDRTANATLPIVVQSKPPVAQFISTNVDASQPNSYILDGSKSFDPDSGKADKLLYKWEVNATPGSCTFYLYDKVTKNMSANGSDCSANLNVLGDDGFSDAEKLKIKLAKGSYNVTLTTKNPNDPTTSSESAAVEQAIEVTNDLDVAWGLDSNNKPSMPISAPLKLQDGQNQAKVTFVVQSDTASACEIDTGDGQKEICTMDPGKNIKRVDHIYTATGAYKIKLTVFDDQNNENSIAGKLYISGADSPIAVISTKKDSDEILDVQVDANRKTVFTFDSIKSLNTDGTTRRLSYSWTIVDQENRTIDQKSARQFTYNFKEIGTYKVKLKVINQDNVNQKSLNDETLLINVKAEPPILRGLTAVPVDSNLTTPVTVAVSAVGAEDIDGRIVSYRWWYYPADADPNDSENQFGLQITQSPNATLTIGTNGLEDESRTYKFAVIITDNENTVTDSSKDLDEGLVPSLEVTNGPNKAPVAKFNVDRTQINVGESVNFSSSSVDQDTDGKIEHYIWDFEGKGFAASTLQEPYDKSNISYTYKRVARDGIKVRLKVIDNNKTEAISEPVTIYIDGTAKIPTAAFTSKQIEGTKKIQFTNNSTADAEGGAKLATSSWDFDANADSNGDGLKDNDADSTESAPTFEYRDYGIYRVKLTVTDDQGGSKFVTNYINVKAPSNHSSAPTSTGTTTTGATNTTSATGTTEGTTSTTPLDTTTLSARLLTTPGATVSDGRIHLQGDTQQVKLDFSTSSGTIVLYSVDKNIYFDSDGDGDTYNDPDYMTTKPGFWTTNFDRAWGPIRIRLTVTGKDGKKDTVDKDIVFDPISSGTSQPVQPKNSLSAFVLAGYGTVDLPVVLVSIVGFGIFVTIMFVQKKRRENTEISSLENL